MLKTPEATACHLHPQNQTRLRCSHCETPICPQCMVQTEVGFKCPGCIQSQSSHLFQVPKHLFALIFGLSILIGYGYGYIHPYLLTLPFTLMGIPLLGMLLAFFSGQALGRVLLNTVQYKRHALLITLMGVGYGIGLLTGPYKSVFLGLVMLIPSLLFSGSGNVMQVGTSAIFSWIQIAIHLFLPFLLYGGMKKAFKA